MKPKNATLVLLFIGLQQSIFMFFITPYGPGIYPDSIVYIETSQNILNGKGFYYSYKPMTHYPPTYPLVLAVISFFEDNKIQAARWLNAIVYGVNVFLFGLCAYKITDHSFNAYICSLLLFISSETMLYIHTLALSEPLFFTFALSGLLVISFYIPSQKSYLLFAASILVAFAILTRYIGITLLPPVVICLFLGSSSFKKKLKDILIILTVSLTPLMIWMIRNYILAGNLTNRTINFHPITVRHLRGFVNAFHDFFIPIDIIVEIKLLLLIILGGVLLYLSGVVFYMTLFKKQKIEMSIIFHSVGTLFFISYIIFLIFSISFIDKNTPVNKRTLSPLYIFLILLFISSCWNSYKIKKNKTIIYLFLACSFFVFYFNLDSSVSILSEVYKHGRGYNKDKWRNSETITFIRTLPNEKTIYTNLPSEVKWLTNNKVKVTSIPKKFSPSSLLANIKFDQELKTMCSNISFKGDYLAFFKIISSRDYLLSLDEIKQKCDISVIRELSDSIIYGKVNPTSEK